ncbi:hypothetical protein [Sulfitobacter sp. JB4-11]|uniref:hypothetical protein n=1 Tax=Sulfitobacter rhodophyticola TaxID=3238304 RepID=UPI003D81C4B3
MAKRRFILSGLALAGLAVLGGGIWARMRGADARAGLKRAETLYRTPLAAPDGPMRVFHLGHSLVGQDMPAMLAQLAGAGHGYESQLGWGTPLMDHWEPDQEINGFETSNDHPRFRDARTAIGSGDYDAVVLTEMVEITDAIAYFDSATYLARWAALAAAGRPDTRLYLYETWHHTDDPKGWLDRIDADFQAQWLTRILYPALGVDGPPIYLIPAGQVMAAFIRAVEDAEGVDGITTAQDLFGTAEDGTPDTIHFNDRGAYLVALTHYAVLYHRSPEGLPHALNRADGTAADAPGPAAAALMQRVVWDVVTALPQTGVAA